MNEKQNVLIVEDELINRRILKKLLSDAYNIIEADNGQQAWEILSDKKNDIIAVMLDIVMPVMNGYGFLAKIKEAHMEDLPIIVMTGETDSETEQKALGAGAWDFVTKPFNARVLRSRLSNAIARSALSLST